MAGVVISCSSLTRHHERPEAEWRSPFACGRLLRGGRGGPTQTRALLAGSPAIDAGNPLGCVDNLSALLASDQRGVTRHVDGDRNGTARCDIGAYEALLNLFLPVVFR